jgi:hypothetical protein
MTLILVAPSDLKFGVQSNSTVNLRLIERLNGTPLWCSRLLGLGARLAPARYRGWLAAWAGFRAGRFKRSLAALVHAPTLAPQVDGWIFSIGPGSSVHTFLWGGLNYSIKAHVGNYDFANPACIHRAIFIR